MQLHHTFYSKKLSSFEIRFLRGSEISKWTRLSPDNTQAPELRELELLIGRGHFHNEEFIVAEREGRLIGRLRARPVTETVSSFVVLDSLQVVDGFDFVEVAQELFACALETARTKTDLHYVEARLDPASSHYLALQRLYTYLGFASLHENGASAITLRLYL